MKVKLKHYACLMRLHKPVGIFLLLWPTLWALWLAGQGHPPVHMVMIFVAGVIVMRSAGCIINDIVDRHVDGHVERTRQRPLVSGQVSLREAIILCLILLTVAFFLAIQLNQYALLLAFPAVLSAIIYPFLKRFTHLPQLGLGIAFAWGVLMAFVAVKAELTWKDSLVFLAAVIWPIVYDTFYAMVDQSDDITMGVKSTAILFADRVGLYTQLLQLAMMGLLILIGWVFGLRWVYFVSLMGVLLLFIYQQYLINSHDRAQYFKAFLNNQWVGLIIFAGIFLSYENSCG